MGNARDVTVDIIGKDKTGPATKSAAGNFKKVKDESEGLKESFQKGVAVVAGFGAAVAVVSKVVKDGLAIGLAKANAQVVLGDAAYANLSRTAKSTANSLGLTQSEYIASAGQAAMLAKNMGFGADVAQKFGAQLPSLAAKISTLSGGQKSAAESSDMLRSALAGEFDPLQAVGINISANIVAMKAQAVQQENGHRLSTQQANAMAVLALVTEQTAMASQVNATEQGKSAQKIAATTARIREQIQAAEEWAAPKIVSGVDQYMKAQQMLYLTVADMTVGNGPGTWNSQRKAIYDTNAALSVGGGISASYAAVVAGTKKAVGDVTWVTKDYTDALDANNSKLLILRGGETGYWAAVDAATAAVKENGRTLDVHTAKGRANREALDGQAAAARNYLSQLQAQGAPAAQFNKTLDSSRAALEATAQRFGMTRAQARAYAAELLSIPKVISTSASFNVAAAQAERNAWVRQLRATPSSVNGTGGFSAGTSFVPFSSQEQGGGRTQAPAPVSVTSNVMLDGAPFYAMTHAAVTGESRRQAYRARTGRR